MSKKQYEVVFKKSAVKDLESLPKKIQQTMLEAIQLLRLNPFTQLLHIKKMKGTQDLYRVRIGDYRIIYLIENQLIKVTIIKIGHRQNVY